MTINQTSIAAGLVAWLGAAFATLVIFTSVGTAGVIG